MENSSLARAGSEILNGCRENWIFFVSNGVPGSGQGWELLQQKWEGEGERAELNKGAEGRALESWAFLIFFSPAKKCFLLWASCSYRRGYLTCPWSTSPQQYRLPRKGSGLFAVSRNCILCHTYSWSCYAAGSWYIVSYRIISYHIISIQSAAFYWRHTFFNLTWQN